MKTNQGCYIYIISANRERQVETTTLRESRSRKRTPTSKLQKYV